MRKAAPGPQLGTGRIRVDAARAIAKLREYQLANRTGWVLEGIRAAVAFGAKRIELTADANDVWLAWEGEPLAADQLPRLLDELVSPDAGEEAQSVRLLAAAVNNALGVAPAYVDVYAITASGHAQRIRYTPDVLEELRNLVASAHEPPTTIARGMLLHLHRSFGLEVLSNLFGAAPELALARAACRDVGVPLVIDGEPVTSPPDVVRIPLGDDVKGYVAIGTQPVGADDVLEVAERGVVLARYRFDVLGVPVRPGAPLRVFVDADRLPSNVSRSQVRRDIHPIATAERRAKAVLPEAIAQLAAKVPGDTTGAARTAALALLATSIGGSPSDWRGVPGVLAPLVALPLVRDAFGDPQRIDHPWRDLVHAEAQPLPRELAPWIGQVVWAPRDDRAVRALLGGDDAIDAAAMRRHARAARRQYRAHQRFLAHARRELVVQTQTAPRARYTLGDPVVGSLVTDRLFEGVTGEVCVYSYGTNGGVALCVDGRELERVELTSPVGFDAVVDSGLLEPAERYRGVARTKGLEAVELRVRAGILRAVEKVAAESKQALAADRELIRAALELARSLSFALTGPLTEAPVWRSAGGEYVSYAQLQARSCFGVVGELDVIEPPEGRFIVHASPAERQQLRALFGKRAVSYQRAVGARPGLDELVEQVPRIHGGAVLIVRDGDPTGVIALAGRSARYLWHRGVQLAQRPLEHTFVPVAIAVDSDAFVPDDKWTGLVDESKADGSYVRWERLLLRAIARALAGDRPPELVEPPLISVGDPTFAALTTALLANDPAEVLGDELLARLRAARVFDTGGDTKISIDDMVASSEDLFYVEPGTPAVAGFAPLRATPDVARLVAKLSGRAVPHGRVELDRRQRKADADRRMEAHMAQPKHPLELASDLPTVALVGPHVRGIVGITSERPQARVFVHDRPFTVLEPQVRYPLAAVVALGVESCTYPFDSVTQLAQQEIIDAMIAAVPRLLEAIAAEKPTALGERGPARRMLGQYLDTGKISSALRAQLREAKAFRTVQGEIRSIVEVEDPPTYLPVAAFGDEWLPPGDGENPAVHDGPVLRVARPADELDLILGRLHMDAVTDVSAEVTRLQARRRMARGLLPAPKLVDVPDDRKRALRTFGALAARLGHGEIGFLETTGSSLLVHEQGQLVRTVALDVMPAIALAVEDPHEVLDYAGIVRVAQDLAVELVRTALPATLSPAIRRNLARAVLARRVPPAALGATPLFPRVNGDWVSWPDVQAQATLHGDVWTVPPGSAHTIPLDATRIVLVVEPEELAIAKQGGQPLVDGTRELELDATARANRSKPASTALRVPIAHGVLATVTLEGDGIGDTRGVVAVLAPSAASERGVYAHRSMHPFDKQSDVCRWPTIAVIDDARLAPDRTWSQPKANEIWQLVMKTLRSASEEALSTFGEVPPRALARLRVTSAVSSEIEELRGAPRSAIRGVMWLMPEGTTSPALTVHDRNGMRTVVRDSALPVGGTIAIFSEDDLDIAQAIRELCMLAHGKLVRQLAKNGAQSDVIATHVVRGLSAGTVKATEVSGVRFDCFVPRALQPRALAELLAGTEPVGVARERRTTGEIAFFDDGSEVAALLRSKLGPRLRNKPDRSDAPPPTVTPPPPPRRTPAPAPVPHVPRPAAKAPPAHPALSRMLTALAQRIDGLGISSFTYTIVDGVDPMIRERHGAIEFAAHHPRLTKIVAEHEAASILSEPALDVLAAHVVSVLNIARSDITDATEQFALEKLLASPPSGGRRRSRRSS